jgi:hypothetical protein
LPPLGLGAHPEDEILDELLGELDVLAARAVRIHVANCSQCAELRRAWQEALREVDGLPASRTEGGASGGRVRLPARRWLRLGPMPGTGARGLGGVRRVRRPSVALMAPAAGTAGGVAFGRLSEARGGDDVELIVRGLDPLPLGRVYTLWADVGDGARHVGAFAVDATGRGQLIAPWPADLPRGGRVTVTAEAWAMPLRPSGAVVLVGFWP